MDDVYPGGAFHRIGKTHASQSSVLRVTNIVRNVSRVSMDCFSFLLAPCPANSNIDCEKQLILGSHEKEESLRISFSDLINLLMSFSFFLSPPFLAPHFFFFLIACIVTGTTILFLPQTSSHGKFCLYRVVLTLRHIRWCKHKLYELI